MIANHLLERTNESVALRANHPHRGGRGGNRGGRGGKSNSPSPYKKDRAVDYIHDGEPCKYGERCFYIYPHFAPDN